MVGVVEAIGSLGPDNVFSVNAVVFRPDPIGNNNIQSSREIGEQITTSKVPSPGDFGLNKGGARSLGDDLVTRVLNENGIGRRVNVLAQYFLSITTYSLFIEGLNYV